MSQAVKPASAPGTAPELDELTLRRAQRGDEDAARALVVCYQRPVFALVSRMIGGDRALVEDVAQETFLHVFRALGSFSPLGAARLSTWILTIASRRAIDAVRRRATRTSASLAGADRGLVASERADRGLERADVAAAVERAVLALPPGQRAALLLREVHDMDYADIARALEVDVGTVKSRLHRARAALRVALTEVRDG